VASIKMDLKEIVYEGVNEFYLAADMGQWLAFVSRVVKLRAS
jgi:hypothetical protein